MIEADLVPLRDELRRIAAGWIGHMPEGVSVEIENRDAGPVVVVIAEVPPFAPKPEPVAEVAFGGLAVFRIGLTFIHHLNNHLGWSGGLLGDRLLGEMFKGLEKWMWKSLEPRRLAAGGDALVVRDGE